MSYFSWIDSGQSRFQMLATSFRDEGSDMVGRLSYSSERGEGIEGKEANTFL